VSNNEGLCEIQWVLCVIWMCFGESIGVVYMALSAFGIHSISDALRASPAPYLEKHQYNRYISIWIDIKSNKIIQKMHKNNI
jgi:hypothetical protein